MAAAPDTRPWPTEVRLAKDRKVLTVTFDSGESFALAAEYLRVMSPSAEVQGHSPDERKTQPGKRQVAILEVHPIGNYAVRLMFDDMHSTGIYSWDYFAELGRNRDRKWQEYLDELASKGLSRDPPQAEIAAATGVRGAKPLAHDHGGADGDPLVEVLDVVVGHAEAAGRLRLTDRIRIVRAVDAIERAAEIHGPRAERIVFAAGHLHRQSPLPRPHLRRRRPGRPFLLGGNPVSAFPLEAGPPDADGIAKRVAALLHEVEFALGGVDDDRARPLGAAVAYAGAGGVGASEAEVVVLARGAPPNSICARSLSDWA